MGVMQEPTPAPTLEPALDGNDITTAILRGFAEAAADWWYVWLLILALFVGMAFLSGWAKRFEDRWRR
jgi:hypothetical protein